MKATNTAAVSHPATESVPSVITTDVSDELWSETGTFLVGFILSREMKFRSDPVEIPFAESPLFDLRLEETTHSVKLKVVMKHDGGLSPEEEKEIVRGDVEWAFLKEGQPYFLALTWDAPAGKLDLYLNGTLQEQLRIRRRATSWTIPESPSGPLRLHRTNPTEGARQDIIVQYHFSSVEPHRWSPERIRDVAEKEDLGMPHFPLTGEGRWEHTEPLDLSGYKLTPLYEADFSCPLEVTKESAFFDGDRRAREPESEWVLEGPGEARTQDGLCLVESVPRDFGNALVLWNTRLFPRDILIEFTMEPENSSKGLGIVFFATRNLDGGSPFAPGLKKRDGGFPRYHSGELNGYHVSYWSANSRPGNILRRTSNLRKNKGFVLCEVGPDHIGGSAPGPQKIRILSVDGLIQVESNGKMVLSFQDDGNFFGPPHADGWIGLRQMGSADKVTYHDFRVSEASRQAAATP
jgi:hypothetical protein